VNNRPTHWLSACLGLLLVCGSYQVQAHAIVVAAQPAANAVVTTPNFPIDLKFNSRIDRSRSRLALIDAQGNARVLAFVKAAPSDRMQAQATAVSPGRYRLEWYVLSADGHITRGSLRLQVMAP
jgi:methionine-rich copper-binding protein CopC